MARFGPLPRQARSVPVKLAVASEKYRIPADSGRYGSTSAKLANKSFQGDL